MFLFCILGVLPSDLISFKIQVYVYSYFLLLLPLLQAFRLLGKEGRPFEI